MKDLITMTAPTMSSKEIAALTGKQHKHVLRDIRNMLEQLVEDGPPLDHEGIQLLRDERNYICEALLDEEMTYTLITGYSLKLRSKVIKRWRELEEKAAAPTPMLADPVARDLDNHKRLALMLVEVCGVDKSFAMLTACKAVDDIHGTQFQNAARLMLPSVEDQFMEPTAHDKRLGLKGVGNRSPTNDRLCNAGYQSKETGEWVPTDKAEGQWKRVPYTKNGHSGLSLTWAVKFIDNLFGRDND